jgi:O-antigen ligase
MSGGGNRDLYPAFVRRTLDNPAPPYMDNPQDGKWAAGLEGQGSQHRVNSLLAVGLAAILVLAPLPLGSNRPAFWTIWAIAVGVLGLCYVAGMAVVGARPRISIGTFWPETVLFAGLLCWILLQIVPIGGLVDLTINTQQGTQIRSRTISLDPGGTRLAYLQFLTYGVLFFLMLQVAANRRRARRMLLTLFVVIAGFAALGLASLTLLGDSILGLPKSAYLGFATGTFVNRNSYATFLAIGIVVGLPMLIEVVRDRSVRTFSVRLGLSSLLIVGLGIIAATLFSTGSRMGTLSAATGAIVAVAAVLFSRRGNWRAAAMGLAVLLAGTIALLGVTGTALLERLVFTDGIDQGRVELHAQTWDAIMMRPLLGYGGEAFASAFPLFQLSASQGDLLWEHAHSTYLALWFELGLVAGSIPLAIVALLGARCAWSIADDSSRVTSAAALGAIFVFAAHSLLDFSAEIEANAFLLVAIVALGAAGAKSDRASISQRYRS